MSGMSRTGEKRNELLTDMVAQIERTLTEQGVPPAQAALAANGVADHMANYWGGQSIYIPADFHWKLTLRELEIYDAFTGHNHQELSRRYEITESGLRRLLARIGAKLASFRNEQQMDLLEKPASD